MLFAHYSASIVINKKFLLLKNCKQDIKVFLFFLKYFIVYQPPNTQCCVPEPTALYYFPNDKMHWQQ